MTLFGKLLIIWWNRCQKNVLLGITRKPALVIVRKPNSWLYVESFYCSKFTYTLFLIRNIQNRYSVALGLTIETEYELYSKDYIYILKLW